MTTLTEFLLARRARNGSRWFWDHVDQSGECWVWQSFTNRKGYGIWRRRLAHRVAWEATNGSIPDGLWALHKCDNPPCVNPEHLYLGTVAENGRDHAERGTPANQNTAKTHCKRGHALAGDNLRIVGGARQCRICDNERSRIKMAKRRAERRAAN